MTKEEIKACIELNRKDFLLVRMKCLRLGLESKRVRWVLGGCEFAHELLRLVDSSLMKCCVDRKVRS